MFPLVYEINTRVWLRELSERHCRTVTLADVPDEALALLGESGFDFVWLMGVWKPSLYSQAIARSSPALRPELLDHLRLIHAEDISASPYAIPAYEVNESLGGSEGLLEFRRRLADMGIRLMLDFVPNHMALDNRWLPDHPDYFVSVSRQEHVQDPGSSFEYTKGRFLAHGRDPYFPSWTDTLQINYANPATHEMMVQNLLHVSELCDAVRCDVAMLVMRDIFNTTWGNLCGPMQEEFWPNAIHEVRQQRPGFLFLGECYWNREWELQQMGFDYTYDKRFYDLLGSSPVNVQGFLGHLMADWEFQKRLCRFIENHDEIRAAERFGLNHAAAALVLLCSPGMHLIHQGEMLGLKKKVPVQLVRKTREQTHRALFNLYQKLFAVTSEPVFHDGGIELIDLHMHEESLCFGFSRSIPGCNAFVLANFSANGIEASFAHPVLAGADKGALTAISTRFPNPPHEWQVGDGSLRIRIDPHEGVLLMLRT